MENKNKLNLEILNENSAAEICQWENRFDESEMENIYDYIINSNPSKPFDSFENLFSKKMPRITPKDSQKNVQYYILCFRDKSGEIVGFTSIECSCMNLDYLLILEYVCVRPDKQKQHIASEMIQASNDFAEYLFQIPHYSKNNDKFESSFDNVKSAINVNNKASIALFKSLGFSIHRTYNGLEAVHKYKEKELE